MSKLPSGATAHRHAHKIYKVAIKAMRVPTAGVCQREFRPGWGAQLAANLNLDALGLPVLNRRDGHYWIIDGQHRIYALKENGFTKDDDLIECIVYENLSDPEAAAVFDDTNTSKAVATMDRFLVRCTRGNDRENEIRRVVESNGLVIGRDKNDGHISCVGALTKAYDLAGSVQLGQTMRTIKKSFDGDAHAFDAQLVIGLTIGYNRYNGRMLEGDMIRALTDTQHGVRGILRKAESQRLKTGNQKAQCVAATVVDIYNKKVPASKRLPPWWKSQPDEAEPPKRAGK